MQPYINVGSQGKIIHFAHANGFPPEAYQFLFNRLTNDYQIIGSKARPLWTPPQDPKQLTNWSLFARDLIAFMDAHGLKKVIGMGHSMGGIVSLLAAHERPDLFEKIILLDPVVLAQKFTFILRLLPKPLLKRIVPIAKVSSNRKDQWASKEEVLKLWRSKKVFHAFSDQALQQLVEATVVPNGRNVTLAYSKEWETQVYLTVPNIMHKIAALKVPITVIKPSENSVITDMVWNQLQQKAPQTQFVEFQNGGHLFPLEYPEKAASLIRTLLDGP